jgi:hypothetical protein
MFPFVIEYWMELERFLCNVGRFLSGYKASHLRRQQLSTSAPEQFSVPLGTGLHCVGQFALNEACVFKMYTEIMQAAWMFKISYSLQRKTLGSHYWRLWRNRSLECDVTTHNKGISVLGNKLFPHNTRASSFCVTEKHVAPPIQRPIGKPS